MHNTKVKFNDGSYPGRLAMVLDHLESWQNLYRATDNSSDGSQHRPWALLPPLVLEMVGSFLGTEHRPDILRARQACKHWSESFGRCIASATLYGDTVLLPAATTVHAQEVPVAACGASSAAAASGLQDDEQARDLRGGLSLPSLATPARSFRVGGSFGPTLTNITVAGMAFDIAWLRTLASVPALTSLTLGAACYNASTARTQHAATAVQVVPAGKEGSEPMWPAAPTWLQRLCIHITRDMPADALQQLLLPSPLLPQVAEVPEAPAASQPPLALRELELLPHSLTPLHTALALDLSPLLDPRLSGVTRLVLPSLPAKRTLPPLHPWQQLPGQHQAPDPPNALGAGSGSSREDAKPNPMQVVGRLTQLRSLEVLDQVDLASFGPACLPHLTSIETLKLAGGCFVAKPQELQALAALTRLTSLEINFGYHWRLDAGDLCILSRLEALRQLSLGVDYSLADSWAAGQLDNDSDSDDAVGHGPDEAHNGSGEFLALAAPDVGLANLRELGAELLHEWHRTGGARGPLGAGGRGPGAGDDWRRPFRLLTQLTSLELQLCNGGGRNLAEAVHLTTGWLHAEGDGGITLSLNDAPAAALLDVQYWGAVAAMAGCVRDVPSTCPVPAGGIAATQPPGSIAASVPPAPTASPLLPSPQLLPAQGFRAAPLVSLELGSGYGLSLSYGHLLCLAVMTELCCLRLSCEAAPRPAWPVSDGGVGNMRPCNPLLALSRLCKLRTLDLRIKQPRPNRGAPGAGSNTAQAAASVSTSEPNVADTGVPPLAPVDDSVVCKWMWSMPLLQELSLRGVGRLGDPGLSAIGSHGALKSLSLRLKTPLWPPGASPGPEAESHASNGTAAAKGYGQGTVRLGYGSCYAPPPSRSCSFGRFSFVASRTFRRYCGVSPAIWGTAAVAAAGGGGDGRVSTVDRAGTEPGCSFQPLRGRSSSSCRTMRTQASSGSPYLASAPGPSTKRPAGSLHRQAARKSRAGTPHSIGQLSAGAVCGIQLLQDVPYLIRPHHLPPSLTALDLTNAAFTAEWATCTLEQVEASRAASGVTAGAPGAAGVTPGPTLKPGKHSSENGASAGHPLARLSSLRLARVPSRQRAAAPPYPDATRITDWHLAVLLPTQPCLSDLALEDPDGGAEAGTEANLHASAVETLRELRYLKSLRLAVGARLQIPPDQRGHPCPQETLFASLPSGLRRLHLTGAGLRAEALALATRLTNLALLQLTGFAEPDDVPKLQAAAGSVAQTLLGCTVVAWYRNMPKNTRFDDAYYDDRSDDDLTDDDEQGVSEEEEEEEGDGEGAHATPPF